MAETYTLLTAILINTIFLFQMQLFAGCTVMRLHICLWFVRLTKTNLCFTPVPLGQAASVFILLQVEETTAACLYLSKPITEKKKIKKCVIETCFAYLELRKGKSC